MKITNAITLDVAHSNSYVALFGKQYDKNSRFLQIALQNGAEPLVVPSGAAVVLRGNRADGLAVNVLGTVNEDGTATVEIDDFILEVAGEVILSVEISKGGEVLTTASFRLTIQTAEGTGWVLVYVTPSALVPGSYYIELAGQPYGFTTSVTIPSGGAIYFSSDKALAQTRKADGTVLEDNLPLTASASGTELESDEPTISFLGLLAAAVEAASGYAANARTSASEASESAGEAAQDAHRADQAAGRAEAARDEIEGMRATAETLPPGSEATASYEDGVLHFGIPQGERGDVSFASFEIDPDTGLLTMYTDPGLSGDSFRINENGYLEVLI